MPDSNNIKPAVAQKVINLACPANLSIQREALGMCKIPPITIPMQPIIPEVRAPTIYTFCIEQVTSFLSSIGRTTGMIREYLNPN